jgi:hypothetical protein
MCAHAGEELVDLDTQGIGLMLEVTGSRTTSADCEWPIAANDPRYRKRAEEAEARVETTRDPSAKQAYLEIAQQWRQFG